MLRWLRARNRHVYYLVLYGRALRRPKICKNLIAAVANNTVRAITKRLKRPTKDVSNDVSKPSRGSQADPTEGIGAAGRRLREHVATKEKLRVKGSKRGAVRGARSSQSSEGDTAANKHRETLVSKSEQPDITNAAKTRNIVQTAASTTLSAPGSAPDPELDALTTPIIPGHEERPEGPSVPNERIPADKELGKDTAKARMANALMTLFRRVPFQLQLKLTEEFNIQFKDERQARQSALQRRAHTIPTHKMSFVPYIKDMTVDDKEALLHLFELSKYSPKAVEAVQKQVSNLRPMLASLDRDILPGAKLESHIEPHIGWDDTFLGSFAGEIFLHDRQTATMFAQEESWLRADSVNRYVYYIDVGPPNPGITGMKGSRVGIARPQRFNSGGATHDRWELFPAHIRDELDAGDAAAAGLVYLLLQIRNIVDDGSATGITIAIFTNDRECLSQLTGKSPLDSRQTLRNHLLSRIIELVNHIMHHGVRMELHWVPRQVSVIGNKIAQDMANTLSIEDDTIRILNKSTALTKHAPRNRPIPDELVQARKEGRSLLEQMEKMSDDQKKDLVDRLKNTLQRHVGILGRTADLHLNGPNSLRPISLDRDIYKPRIPEDPLALDGDSITDMSDHVFVLPRAEAIAFAFEDEHVRGSDHTRDVYWTDAGNRAGHAVMACVIQKRMVNRQLASTFKMYTWKLRDGKTTSDIAELAAMILTLKEAWERRVKVTPGGQMDQTKTIVIYTDSQISLAQLSSSLPAPGDTSHERWLLMKLMEWIRRYKCVGIHVQLIWVPGHEGVPGNELANVLAKVGNRRGPPPPKPAGQLLDAACESTPKELIQLVPTADEIEHILSKVFKTLHMNQQRQLAGLFGIEFDPAGADHVPPSAPYESLSRCMQHMSVRDKVLLARGLMQHVEISGDVFKKVRRDWVARNWKTGEGKHALGTLEAKQSHQKGSFANLNLQGNTFIRPWAEAIAFALEYDILTTESLTHHSCHIDMCFDERRDPPTPCFAIANNIRTDEKREFLHTEVVPFDREVDPLAAQLIGIITALADVLTMAQKDRHPEKQVITIFSDFRSALKLLQGGSPSLHPQKSWYPLAKEVGNLVSKLDSMGIEIQMHWVPGDAKSRGSTMTQFLHKMVMTLDTRPIAQISSPTRPGINLELSQISSMTNQEKEALLGSYLKEDVLGADAMVEITSHARSYRYRTRSLNGYLSLPVAELNGSMLRGKEGKFVPLTIDKDVFIRSELDSAIFAFHRSIYRADWNAGWVFATPEPTEGGHAISVANRIRRTETSPQLRWNCEGILVTGISTPLVAELAAITFHFNQLARLLNERNDTILIFCANKEILECLAGRHPLPDECEDAATLFARISQWFHLYASGGYRVEFHWVPPGMPVAGLKVADAVADDVRWTRGVTASKGESPAVRSVPSGSKDTELKGPSNDPASPQRERQPRPKKASSTASRSDQRPASSKRLVKSIPETAAEATGKPGTKKQAKGATGASPQPPKRKKKTPAQRKETKRQADQAKTNEIEAKQQDPSNNQPMTTPE